MTIGYSSVNHYQTKFYQKEVDSKKFLDLSEEQLINLSKKVYEKQELMESVCSNKQVKISKLDKYQRVLQYLTNPRISFELKTFDEKMACLIMMIDPNLVTFREFLKINLVSLTEINNIKNEKERGLLKKIRSQNISRYESIVREKVGFFDPKLLKHEEFFFKKFFNEKVLITEVNNNNQGYLMSQAKFLKDFNSISNERYEELVSVANDWLSLVQQKHNTSVATYSVTIQRKLLGLNNLAEQLALFILLIDSNLDILRIYEEESTMNNIEKRINLQFGYFNQELLVLERKFHERFCPEKDISVWSEKTKTLKR